MGYLHGYRPGYSTSRHPNTVTASRFTFSQNSFGFRPNRNAHQAVIQVQGFIKQKRHVAVDVDLSKFFDRVNHNLLM